MEATGIFGVGSTKEELEAALGIDLLIPMKGDAPIEP